MRTAKPYYVSFDGLLQPIAQANVLPYLGAIPRGGSTIRVVSLEKPDDLANAQASAIVRHQLAELDAIWLPLRYSAGGGLATIKNLIRVYRAIAGTGSTVLIHARSYPPALAAWIHTRLHGGRYIFDMRGYWIDEKRAVGRWFYRPIVYEFAKRLERRLVRDAATVVTLTKLQADDLQSLRPPGETIAVVPTCTDYDRWQSPSRPAPLEARERLANRLVVAYVGSHTNSYLLQESIRLFGLIRQQRPDAHLLCLAREGLDLQAAINNEGLPPGSWSLQAASYADMPGWLALAQWGLLMLAPGLAKRGSMPTKLAEFLAAGVRPIFYGCNSEVADLVERAGSAVVLDSVDSNALKQAATAIATSVPDPALVAAARERTRPILDIRAGSAIYAEIYARLGLSGEVEVAAG